MPRPIIQGPYRTFRRLNQNETFLEFEGSTITVDLKARKSPNDEWMREELKLRAFMRLEIFPAYENNLGTREFQFIIRDWWLHGKSEMLSRLFFDNDPRGFDLEQNGPKVPGTDNPKYCDYVPASVTFNVSNNYEVEAHPITDSKAAVRAEDIFASARELEIRNLTSHHTRVWSDNQGRGQGRTYSLPGNRIFWQIVPADKVNGLGLLDKDTKAPVVVFHKKPARLSEDRTVTKDSRFDVRNGKDRADFLLAIAPIGKDGRITASSHGGDACNRLEALSVQQHGNVTLSPHYRPIRDLEIRWRLAKGMDLERLAELVRNAAPRGGDGVLSGSIRIVSPARSLGTAEQGPVGDEPYDSCDFPARLTYAVNYNIFINREQFVEDQAGIAIAVGALEIPPRDVTVAFDKPHIGQVLSQYLEFGPGHCTGMHEIPEHEFEHGVKFCRYWRTVPLKNDPGSWTDFEDFDPETFDLP